MKLESYKFSTSATPTPPDILSGRTPEQFLAEKYQQGCMFGLDHLQKSGVYLLAGWSFNFRPFMKQFLVKQHDEWHEVWAMNKTSLRKSLYGRIEKIVEHPAILLEIIGKCKNKECKFYKDCDCKDIYRACNTFIEWVKGLYNEIAPCNR